jgi:hypothetical protein
MSKINAVLPLSLLWRPEVTIPKSPVPFALGAQKNPRSLTSAAGSFYLVWNILSC